MMKAFIEVLLLMLTFPQFLKDRDLILLPAFLPNVYFAPG